MDNQNILLENFYDKSAFGFWPKTEEEWKLFYVVEHIMKKYHNRLEDNLLHYLMYDSILALAQDDGFRTVFDEIDFADCPNGYLLPVNITTQYVFNPDIFYYNVNSEDTTLKIDLNQLDNYKDLSLVEVLILSTPTEENNKRIEDYDKDLLKGWVIKESDVMIECALFTFIYNKYSHKISNKRFGKQNLLNGYLAEYLYSVVDYHLDKNKDDLNINNRKYLLDVKSKIVKQLKSDLTAKPDSMPKQIKKLKKSLVDLFNDESGYGYDNIYKYNLFLNEICWGSDSTNKLVDWLTKDIYKKFISRTNPDRNNFIQGTKYIQKTKQYNKITEFLKETTIGDLVEYGIDLNHKNLKNGIPLLPLIYEFSKDIGIRFNKNRNFVKLSDITKNVEINH